MKPSHIKVLKKLGYIDDNSLICFASEESTSKPKDDEIVVFKGSFRVGLQLSIHRMVGEVIKKYEVYMHQLTQNEIMRLGVFIWVVRSQGARANAECFCRVHELHYQTKARFLDKLNNNFGCYNFSY